MERWMTSQKSCRICSIRSIHLNISPGTSLNWTRISAFLEFKAFPAFRMKGTPVKRRQHYTWANVDAAILKMSSPLIQKLNRRAVFFAQERYSKQTIPTFPSFIMYTKNHSCKCGGVWEIRNSGIIPVSLILSQNHLFISNWKYWL